LFKSAEVRSKPKQGLARYQIQDGEDNTQGSGSGEIVKNRRTKNYFQEIEGERRRAV